MTDSKGKLVYSTRAGDTRKQGKPSAGPSKSLPPAQQNLKIMRDKKGRRGKMVTVVAGLVLTEDDAKELSKTLKALCGAGGTVKSNDGGQVIEIQGDHRDKVADKLKDLGYKVKFAGG